MNKSKAKKIAEVVTIEKLKGMFDSAKENITNWEEVSAVNKGMTKGTVWNILYDPFCGVVKKEGLEWCLNHQIAVKNMIWEFGDFLNEDFLNQFRTKKKVFNVIPHHENPDFNKRKTV